MPVLANQVIEFTIGGRVGFTGITIWINEGVQVKKHLVPWEEVVPQNRPGGEKWDGVITENGVQFYKTNGSLVWFPGHNITKVEATDVR